MQGIKPCHADRALFNRLALSEATASNALQNGGGLHHFIIMNEASGSLLPVLGWGLTMPPQEGLTVNELAVSAADPERD
jgi:hypothetical protein